MPPCGQVRGLSTCAAVYARGITVGANHAPTHTHAHMHTTVFGFLLSTLYRYRFACTHAPLAHLPDPPALAHLDWMEQPPPQVQHDRLLRYGRVVNPEPHQQAVLPDRKAALACLRPLFS